MTKIYCHVKKKYTNYLLVWFNLYRSIFYIQILILNHKFYQNVHLNINYLHKEKGEEW